MTYARKRFEFTVICTVFLVLCYCIFCQSCQRRLADDMIRFRVVANSDSERDQNIKLKVRDAVLGDIAQWECPDDVEKMLAMLDSRQDEIMQTVRNTLSECGADENCRIEIAESDYPTRYYNSFALPAGKYTGVQIFLGDAEGHNWWCVIYPSLCIDAASGEKQLSEDEKALIHTKNTGYTVRFKTAEIIGELGAMFP